MRVCNICGKQGLEGAEFYKGVTSRCAECHKTKVRENRAENFERYQAYEAMRYRNDPRRKEAIRAYAQTEAGKASQSASKKRWIAQNPDKRAAHVILGNAVRDKRIIKPNECQSCGKINCRIEAHHQDYAFPLEVKWLCRICHVSEHRST